MSPYTLSFSTHNPGTGITTSVTDNAAAASVVFQRLPVLRKVFIHDCQTLVLCHSEANPSQAPEDYYLMCCDCGS